MRTRTVRVQLLVFGVVGLLAVGYAVFSYMGLQRYSGIGRYTVQAEMESAGGLYVNSLVTYRGVDIGVVTELKVNLDEAVATLQLQSGIDVPSDTEAIVKSISAIGEQYIDLVPATSEGPYLSDGDSIGMSRTSVPTPSSEVVEEVHTLLDSLPKDDLRTTVDESFAAFDGLGPSLGTLIDSSRPLISLAQANIGPTERLIADAEPVLGQINESGADISSFSSNLSSFTQQLAMDDGQIRAVLDQGPAFFDAVNGTLSDLESPLPVLLANLQSVGEVARVNIPGIRQLLVVYPAVSASINHMHQGFQGDDLVYGQGPLDIKLGNTANPLPCTEGYDTARRDPGDLSPAEPAADSYCKLPQDDARVVRGARNAPCATDPSVRTGELSECPAGLPSTWPQMLARPGAPYIPSAGSPPAADVPATEPGAPDGSDPEATPASFTQTGPAVASVPYDPFTGRFRAPDGEVYRLGNIDSVNNDQEDPTWQALFA
ncbi:MlaD family protein [Rhodococcus sp. 14-2483-1-2]|uniref:MCE family protein n=1 Tax=Rhodococcus sp. 14-2483-1-2 TaxID=2023147 RepID=UPI000B9A4FB1|nr:MlaD family protein [Rhodococcus sp. 14-2483-1-2]OZF34655.1 mammalian cell entry protein [Rhodococcus sp. 14-2483-1-2]